VDDLFGDGVSELAGPVEYFSAEMRDFGECVLFRYDFVGGGVG